VTHAALLEAAYHELDQRLGEALAAIEAADMKRFDGFMHQALSVSNAIGHLLVSSSFAPPPHLRLVRPAEPKAVLPATTRRRRYRARQRAGRAILTIEIASCELIATLLAAGYVSAAQSVDRRAVEAATSRVVADWVKFWREQHASEN
jgi:hypothetical protein